MGKAKKTRKFAAVKRMINPKDMRIKKNQKKAEEKRKRALAAAAPRHVFRRALLAALQTRVYNYRTTRRGYPAAASSAAESLPLD